MSLKFALLGVICCVTPTLLHAQARPEEVPADLGETEVEELVVTASGRLRGAALGDVPPEVTFSAGDVRSLGVSSINELLAELAPQTTSGRGGAPVVLLGGRRISSMAEVRDIPTEAIARVEVLPEEVALKYGYAASQKVVNIVLRQRFRANTSETSLSAPTKGGQTTAQLDGSRLQLDNEGRLNLAVRYQRSGALLESDRDILSSTDGSGPYALDGNITSAIRGAQIDPQLSALAGSPVAVAGLPGRAAIGPTTLGDFAALAGMPNSGDVTDLRSLRPQTQQVSVNAVIQRTVFDNVGATLNLSAAHSDTTALLGPARTRLTIPGANPFSPFQDDIALYRYRGDLNALEQNTRTVNGHMGVTFDGDLKSWRWTLTGNYDRTGTRTLTDRSINVTGVQARIDALDPTLNPFGALPYADFNMDRARSLSDTGDVQLVLNGVLTRLPAGDLSTTVKVGAEGARLESYSRRAGLETEGTLSRGTGKLQVSMDAPLAKTSVKDVPFVGNLSANLNLAVDSLSDFGQLTTIGYGLTWSPVSPLNVVVSMTDEETAPSMQQLGGPVIATPDARVFDFVNGETVDVTRISGGNPGLKAQDSQTLKAQMTFKPPQVNGLTLNATYLRTRTDNLIAAFPAATAETEAAFPARFLRDLDGTLIRIDARPVNFERQESDQIRWGLNFSRQIGAPPPRTGGAPWRQRGEARGEAPAAAPQAGGAPSAPGDAPAGMNLLQGALPQGGQRPPRPRADNPLASPGAGRFGPGGRGGFGGGFGPGGPRGGATRIQFAVYHTLHLRERVVIADGLAPLDLLEGDTLNSGGGQPRHEIEVQTGVTRRGMGARVSANWQSATEVDGGVSGATGRLRFSDLTTVNLRLFANLGAQREWVTRYPVLRGMRVTLSVDNLFDAQMDVKDAAGVTPINYQPDYLDPLGRSVRLSVRKVFF